MGKIGRPAAKTLRALGVPIVEKLAGYAIKPNRNRLHTRRKSSLERTRGSETVVASCSSAKKIVYSSNHSLNHSVAEITGV